MIGPPISSSHVYAVPVPVLLVGVAKIKIAKLRHFILSRVLDAEFLKLVYNLAWFVLHEEEPFNIAACAKGSVFWVASRHWVTWRCE